MSRDFKKAVAKSWPKKSSRNYSEPTKKALFGLSGNVCAEPNCTQPLVMPPDGNANEAVLGKIAHIIASSDDGPRGDSSFDPADRDKYPNLILLCGPHHDVVDVQHENYPADMLRQWKSAHEKKYIRKITQDVAVIGMAELDIAANALISSVMTPTASSTSVIIPPDDKITKNSLDQARIHLTMGAAKSAEVEQFLIGMGQIDYMFPERLREGFVTKYQEFKGQGLVGDELFFELYDWAGGPGTDRAREAAGLCILSHLFIICDVFET